MYSCIFALTGALLGLTIASPISHLAPRDIAVIPGYKYQGCYTDSVNDRVLNSQTLIDYSMTIEMCQASCSLDFFGVEYGRECWCGTELDSSAILKSDTECSFACPGDSQEQCGAGDRISLYSIDSAVIVSPDPTPVTYTALGCYTDSTDGRALLDKAVYSDSMTVESCASICAGYTYFGVEYSRECYCGASISPTSTTAPSTDCMMTCSGASSEICGGNSRLNLYSFGTASTTTLTTITATPTSSPAPKYTSVGCYTDSTIDRVLSENANDDNMTIEKCEAIALGYIYYGVEYGKECWYGNTLKTSSVAAARTDCNFQCPGNTGESCGAGDRLSLYQLVSTPILTTITTTSPTSSSMITSTTKFPTTESPTVSTTASSTQSSSTSSTTAPVATPTNLFVSGDFETGEWSGPWSPWIGDTYTVESPGYSGDYSGVFNIDATDSFAQVYMTYSIALEVGGQYNLEFDFKLGDQACSLRIQTIQSQILWVGSGGAAIATNVWTSLGGTFIANATIETIYVLGDCGFTVGSLYFDNFSLYPVSNTIYDTSSPALSANMISNPGFESGALSPFVVTVNSDPTEDSVEAGAGLESSFAFQSVVPGEGQILNYISQAIPTVKGHVYRLSVDLKWEKDLTSACLISIRFVGSNSYSLAATVQDWDVDAGQWYHIAGVANVQEDNTPLQIQLYCYNSGAVNTIWVDNVSAVALS